MNQLDNTPFVWQENNWPYFYWNSSEILDPLVTARKTQGQWMTGSLLLSDEKNLSPIHLDIQQNIFSSLTKERLCGWQASLFPTGYLGIKKIKTGDYRQITQITDSSYSPPDHHKLTHEMNQFLNWWNDSPVGLDGLIRAALAHFWITVLQPFDEGNQEIAIALSELALAQDEQQGVPLYNFGLAFSAEMLTSGSEVLRKSLSLKGDLTLWLVWYFELHRKIILSNLPRVQQKIKILNFWNQRINLDLNPRQKKALNHLLTAPDFESQKNFITNRLYTNLTGAGRETAKRDIAQLETLKIFKRNGAKGRSTSYSLIL